MTTIVTRLAKGSPLSWTEADANFINLNTDKAEVSVVALKAPLASPNLTGVPTTPSTAIGNIVATNVQAALEELDTEKASLTGATFSGQVTATKLQTGVSGTNTNNFILDASAADGTMKLERGDGQDIMTVDAAGKVAFPQNFDKLIGLVVFDGFLTGTNPPLSGFGVTSVTRNSQGNYTLNLSTTYSNNNHIVSAMSDAGMVQAPQWINATTNSITIGNYNQAGAPTDATRIMMTIHRVTS